MEFSREWLRGVLIYCSVINYAFLVLWVLVYMLARGPLTRLSRRWFALSDETFDAINYGGILLYKVAIFLFNLVPLAAVALQGV